MEFKLIDFIRLRPSLLHLTSTANLKNIEKGNGRMLSASNLNAVSPNRFDETVPRQKIETITLNGAIVHVRDQRPLRENGVTLVGGWTFQDLLNSLNSRVFFWPGTEAGKPIPRGQTHFAKYLKTGEDLAAIEINTASMFERNPHVEFSKFNSGSSGNNPKTAVRGPKLFSSAQIFEHNARKVVEVTFPSCAVLPDTYRVYRKCELLEKFCLN